MAAKKAKRTRKVYTEQYRARVLAAAKQRNLTAEQVEKRYGVKAITYYSWRKKSGVSMKRAGTRRPKRRIANGTVMPAVDSLIEQRGVHLAAVKKIDRALRVLR